MTKNLCQCLRIFGYLRREGGRGTEISTLPGGQNLGEITDIEYFKKKLLQVPQRPAKLEWMAKVDLISVDPQKS